MPSSTRHYTLSLCVVAAAWLGAACRSSEDAKSASGGVSGSAQGATTGSGGRAASEGGQGLAGEPVGPGSGGTNAAGSTSHRAGASDTGEAGIREEGGAPAAGGAASTDGLSGYADPDIEPTGPLPVLWLTAPGTSDPDDIGLDDEPATLRVIEEHDGTHSDPAAFASAPATLESPVTIHTRGKSSQGFDKKNYALELLDDAGQEVKRKLLGLPKESDWVLHGPYTDKTYLRNALAYWLGREIYRLPDGSIEQGRWSPHTRFVEIYLNERYWGVYVVVEKIKADSDRVDVDRPAPDAQSGDVTGGYIIRREGGGDGDGKDWVSQIDQLVYTHQYPKLEDLSAAQRDYIRGYFDSFEAMMEGSAWSDPSTGYPAWVDVTSMLDYFLAMEWSNDVDGYFKSVYMVKHAQAQGGKLSFGPLWDFDIAFGNADYRGGQDSTNWVHEMRGTEDSLYDPPGEVPFIPPYVTRLWGDTQFRHLLRCRWEALRAGPLASVPIEAKIDVWVERLADAEVRDHERWPVIGVKLWPNPVVWSSYEEEIAYLKRFLRERFEFMDGELAKVAPGACE